MILRQARNPSSVAAELGLCYTISMVFASLRYAKPPFVSLVLLAGVLLVTTACATPQSSPKYQEGQIIAVAQDTVLTIADLRPVLRKADVIYIGETHYTPSHLDAAIQVLQIVLDEGRTPILGMEMFSWDGQSGIDRYLKGDIATVDQFLTESHWKDNWGGKYEDYSPLVDFAKTHQFRLLGLNPPRPFVRKVAQNGLMGIGADPVLQQWNFPDPFPADDPEYRRVIYDQIEKCHGGMKPEVYQKIYEASVFRDEGMASVIATTMSKEGVGRPQTFVSYTGAGHIQYGLPIPKRVQRQMGGTLKQVTLYLHALDPEYPEDVEYLINENIADFVWLTTLGPQGRQPRCGE
ncbi:ChaN family lipoprotein [Candidatus Nitronereus thalassa]|uniref:ChaN family lipoprotein n=1 Tax=Candidatus Nitronereus thalassa TaxID=3020898 RepID=A0ABU3K8H8_9BACT|nr:ChaN family lipoprotein [Candidatus Nitronereus thalassa]MDT7042717.1 ChaN family lipoprotein [Candidatus Nitronereus thalassa]